MIATQRDTATGYQRTEVGVIPDDWNVVPITHATRNIFLGLTSRVDYVEHGGVPLVRASDIAGGRLSFDEARDISVRQHKKLTQYRKPSRGDVLVSKSGSLGVCAIVDTDREFSIYESIIVLQPRRTLDSGFLLHLMRAEETQTRMIGERVGSTVSHLNLMMFRELRIPVPPTLAEQEAIAEALGDADALIESLEQLVAKKRHLKQAAMQQLLTGKKRLPGFEVKPGYKQTEVGVVPKDWSVEKIESIVSEISMGPFGSDIKVSNFVAEGVPVLSGANVRAERLQDGFKNFVSPAKAKSLKKTVARRGDIVVTHRGTIGQVAYIPEESEFEDYVISQSQFRVRFDHRCATPSWVVLYFHSEHGAKALLEKKGHTGVPAISQATTTFKSLHLPLPELTEQRAINEVLSDMDTAIAAAEAKLSKARQIKQGMMQVLLTGQVRLVTVES